LCGRRLRQRCSLINHFTSDVRGLAFGRATKSRPNTGEGVHHRSAPMRLPTPRRLTGWTAREDVAVYSTRVGAAHVLHAAHGLPIPIADSDVADNVISTGAAGGKNVPAVDGNARGVPVTDRDAPIVKAHPRIIRDRRLRRLERCRHSVSLPQQPAPEGLIDASIPMSSPSCSRGPCRPLPTSDGRPLLLSAATGCTFGAVRFKSDEQTCCTTRESAQGLIPRRRASRRLVGLMLACDGGGERAMLGGGHSQRIYTNVKGEDFTTPGRSGGHNCCN
jgi:hypothetical protein